MSSTMGGDGFPGGFPSMPGFGGVGSAQAELLDRLEELTERHRTGALTDEEFSAEKDRLISEG